MGWGKWFGVGAGEEMTEKVTKTPEGGEKYESLRTNNKSKEDHQHTWVNTDPSGNTTSGGATPGKK